MTREEIAYVKNCIQEDIHRFYIWGKWEKKREEVLRLDRYECQDCKRRGKITRATTVHHNKYLKKFPELALEIYYEQESAMKRNLVSLCHDCHEIRHDRRQKKKKLLTEEKW